MAAVVLTGAPGSGKSATAEALSDLLADAGITHGALELEHLAWGHPWLSFEAAVDQLAAVIAAQRALGRSLFVIVATTETDDQLERLVAAIGGEPVLVVALRTDPQSASDRILAREPLHWSGRDALARHARQLAATIPALARVDLVIDTDGDEDAPAIARAIRDRIAEREA